MFGLLMLAVSFVAVYLVWQNLKNRPIVSDVNEATSGQLLRFGKTVILHRAASDRYANDNLVDVGSSEDSQAKAPAKFSIICFPGFMETMQYFTQLYKDFDVDLIVINNIDYHNPFQDKAIQDLDWKDIVPYREGTIAYDAAIVNLVIKHLVKTDRVIVHGHSRGGAVVLDAARQNQKQFSDIDLLLEAPVLPQAFLPQGSEMIYYYGGRVALPFLIPLVNALPPSLRQKSPLFIKMSERKSELLTPMLANPNNAEILFKQSKDILQWPATTTFDVFDNGQSCTIVIGESDKVLSRRRMKASALQAEAISLTNPSVDIQIVETTETDHFISIEQPMQMRSVIETIMNRPINKVPSSKKARSSKKVE